MIILYIAFAVLSGVLTTVLLWPFSPVLALIVAPLVASTVTGLVAIAMSRRVAAKRASATKQADGFGRSTAL